MQIDSAPPPAYLHMYLTTLSVEGSRMPKARQKCNYRDQSSQACRWMKTFTLPGQDDEQTTETQLNMHMA